MTEKSTLSRIGQHPQMSLRSEVSWGSWEVAQPLHMLTSGENTGKKKAAIQWDFKCQQAFYELKRLYHCTYSCMCTFHQTIQASH